LRLAEFFLNCKYLLKETSLNQTLMIVVADDDNDDDATHSLHNSVINHTNKTNSKQKSTKPQKPRAPLYTGFFYGF